MILSNYLIKSVLTISLFFNLNAVSFSEIMILSGCENLKDGFIKNEYILDLEKSLMTRSYIYNDKTYKKYHETDLSIKKENKIERFIYEQENLILTDKIGYPLFYTQLLFKKNNLDIKIMTVINNETAISSLSKCKKIETFKKES